MCVIKIKYIFVWIGKGSHPKLAKTSFVHELVHVATIGLGSFGFVDMVRRPSEVDAIDGSVYALKRISKQFVRDRGFERKILQEKATLAQLDSPFVLKLLQTFQDERWLYLLTEIALGGDLMELMCDQDKLDDATIRFLAPTPLSAR